MNDNSPAAILVSKDLQDLAREIDTRLLNLTGQRIAFTLLIWTDNCANYISSADRQEVATQLRGLLDYWEAGGRDVPAHEVN